MIGEACSARSGCPATTGHSQTSQHLLRVLEGGREGGREGGEREGREVGRYGGRGGRVV